MSEVPKPPTQPNGAPALGDAAKAAGDAAKKAAKPPPAYSHLFRLMGMPNFRFRLPSRNWSIFLTIVGSWYGAYWYDRREKKRIMESWCSRVSHLAEQPFPTNAMPRKVTIVLATPPADGLLTAREHFHEYVKPILVAGGMDWDAIEGRKEGDVRAMVAERIRELRMRAGEPGEELELDEKEENKEMIRLTRLERGIQNESSMAGSCAGDIVIGRNTWKEYIRGLHEGWLGPTKNPHPPEPVATETPVTSETPETPVAEIPASEPVSKTDEFVEEFVTKPAEQLDSIIDSITTSESTADPKDEEKKAAEESQEKKEGDEKKEEAKKPEKGKRKQPPPFIKTTEYSDSSLPPTLPQRLGPTVTVPMPHILGFLNTPKRMYRFLRQRDLADDIGRQVTAAVLAAHVPYQQKERELESDGPEAGVEQTQKSSLQWEQERFLTHEEAEWHKSIRKEQQKEIDEGNVKEHVWLDPVTMDARIASRMFKFVLPEEAEGSS